VKAGPGYPLPDGELGEDELVCQLVYLPDRPEYWQALLAAVHYMTTWRAWGRDSDKRGKDAAANWRAAFELTIGCWRMTCLQELQDNVAAILEIMQSPNDCCVDSDVTGGNQYTDRVDDGVGDVPQNVIDAGYADDAADWDGFDDYKCMISHVLIGQIGPRLEGYLPWIDFGGKWLLTITIIAAFATIILATGGAVLALGIVATTGTIAALYFGIFDLDSLEDLIEKVADNYDALVCAVYFSDGDESSLIALNDKINELFNAAESLVLTNLNLGPTLKALYAGRYDQQNIAATLEEAGYDVGDFDCECLGQIGEYLVFFDWEDGEWSEWVHDGLVLQDFTGRDGGWGVGDAHPKNTLWHSTGTLRREVDLTTGGSATVYINRVTFWYRHNAEGAGDARLLVQHDEGSSATIWDNSFEWAYASKTFNPPLACTDKQYVVALLAHNMVSNAAFYDDITIDFDTGPSN
jgi:hypothetical protein